MADRYWVGGTGNWNDTAKWSATSGGAGGETVPTAADNAYFDGSSDSGAAFTVTVNVASTCLDLIVGNGSTVTALDQVMTLAGSSSLTISGSLFYPATSFTRTYTGSITFNATTTGKTITTNGALISSNNMTINGVGGEWTLGSSLTGANNNIFYVLNGTFNTANFAIAGFIAIDWRSTVNLGSSQITLNQYHNAGAKTVNFEAGLTINAGTSTFNISVAGAPTLPLPKTLNFAGKTIYDVIINNSTEDYFLEGSNTFNNLTITNALSVNINANQLVNGTLSLRSANTTVTSRTSLISSVLGTARTFTCNATTLGDGVDFRDITIAGTAGTLDGSIKSTGNLGGNTNITFPAAKTVYWNLSGSQNWNATAWATTSTGTPAVANFPLAQDTAVVTEAGAAGTITINAPYSISTLTFDNGVSTRTSVVTLNIVNTTSLYLPTFYGDLKLSSGVIISGTAGAVFAGRNTQNITGAGKTFTNSLTLASPGGTLVLQDNLTTATNQTFTLTSGTLNLNGKVPSFGFINFNNSNTRSIIFGTSKIQVSGNNTIVCDCFTLTNFSYTGSGDIEFTYAGSTGTRTIKSSVGVAENNALNFNFIAGTDTVAGFSGNGQISKNLNFTGFSGTFDYTGGGTTQWEIFGNLTLSANMTFTPRSGTGLIFYSSGTQSIQTNGIAVDAPISKQNAGTLNLDSNLTMGATRTFTHTAGTVNLNGRVLSTGLWSSSNSNIRNLIFGSGQISLTGTGTVWDATTSTNTTITPGTGKIALTNNTNTARTFAGGGLQTYPEVEIGGDTGTSTTTITGANRFAKLTNTKTVAYTIVFPNATTQVTDWNLNGSAGNLITLSRTGGSGTFTINYTGGQYIVGRYLSISNSAATPANRVYAIYSTDGGGNTGWKFDAPKFGSFLSFFSPPL